MNRITSALLVAAIAVFGGTKPADSGPPQVTETFVFKGGDAFGNVLEATVGIGGVDPGVNPNTLAVGIVELPNGNCNAKHYLGELQGQPTPTNNKGFTKDCGWGKLSLVPVGPNALRSYANAWTATETAHRVVLGLRDLGGSTNVDAATQLALAILELDLLGEQLKTLHQAGTITKDQRQSIDKRRQKARERIGLAAATLATLVAKPAIDSRKASLAHLLVFRALVLGKSELTKMLKRMEDAGLVPGAQ